MGRATIIANLGEGRYTIELDYGSAEKEAALTKANERLVSLNQKISEAATKVQQADWEEDAIRVRLEAAIQEYEAQLATWNKDKPVPKPTKYTATLKELGEAQKKNAPIRQLKKTLEKNKADVTKQIVYWSNFAAVEQRGAWCVDYTTNGQAGRSVATIDIPGEDELVLLAPGLRAPTDADGDLRAREIQTAPQAFFNAAILPGWQIQLPMYRTGVIDSIDREANTCTVTLNTATSSAQRLDVNDRTTLENVPIQYGVCNHDAFEEQDRVVVQFDNRTWESPRVIGFVDTPRPCLKWPLVEITFSQYWEPLSDWSKRDWHLTLSMWCGGVGVGFFAEQKWASRTHNVYYVFGEPYLQRVPSGATAAIDHYTLPQPVLLGTTNWQDRNNTVYSLPVPSGGSPAIFYRGRSPNFFNGESGHIVIERYKAPFTERREITGYTYYDEERPCVPDDRFVVGGYFDQQAVGHVMDQKIYNVEISRGPCTIGELAGDYPEVSVTMNGRSRPYRFVAVRESFSQAEAYVLTFANKYVEEWW